MSGKVRVLVMAVVLAALVVCAPRVLHGPNPRMVLTAGEEFTVTGTLSSTPAPNVTPTVFYPGTQEYLVLTATNPQGVAITVNTLGVGVAPQSAATPLPADCPASELDLSQASFVGSLNVPPDHGTASAWLPISLTDTGTDQSGCKGVTFYFNYSGTADYVEVYGTSTVVASSLNPSKVGQSVTYTATVTGNQGTNPDPVPSSPTGTVTFDDGHTVICANVPVTSASTTTSTATCSPTAYLATATHPITVIYADNTGDNNFSGSTSPVLNQVVNPAPTTTVLAPSPIPANFGQQVTLTATVSPNLASPPPTPTGTVSFYLGTPGTHELLGTGALTSSGKATLKTSAMPGGSDSLYAVFGGDANYTTSSSTTLNETVGYTSACIIGTVNGGYTVKSGQSVCFGPGSKVNGGITVQSGGALDVEGSTVNGGITSTGATGLRVCASTVNGGISASSSTGYVVIGDGADDGPPGCAANTVNGGVSITNGGAGFEVAANNISGGLTASGNTDAGASGEDGSEVEGNTISGGLSCATSDNPAVNDGGQKNVVTGSRSGQCSAAGF